MMRDVVICEPVRTAVGAFGGSFKTVHAHELASHVIGELMKRTGVPAEAVAMYDRAGYHPIERYNDNPYAQRWFAKALA